MAVLQPRLHALQSLDNDEPFAAFFRKIPFKAFIKQISTFRRKQHQDNNVLLYNTDELSLCIQQLKLIVKKPIKQK